LFIPENLEQDGYFKYKFEATKKRLIDKYSRVCLLFPNDGDNADIIDRYLSVDEVRTLANNDGFSSLRHFFHYFNENKTYRLIHWTDLIY